MFNEFEAFEATRTVRLTKYLIRSTKKSNTAHPITGIARAKAKSTGTGLMAAVFLIGTLTDMIVDASCIKRAGYPGGRP
jgi:hypothetical protein